MTESFGKSSDGETVRKAVIFQAGKDGRLSVATTSKESDTSKAQVQARQWETDVYMSL